MLVEDRAPPGQPGLLGLYHGIPLTRRGAGYSGALFFGISDDRLRELDRY